MPNCEKELKRPCGLQFLLLKAKKNSRSNVFSQYKWPSQNRKALIGLLLRRDVNTVIPLGNLNYAKMRTPGGFLFDANSSFRGWTVRRKGLHSYYSFAQVPIIHIHHPPKKTNLLIALGGGHVKWKGTINVIYLLLLYPSLFKGQTILCHCSCRYKTLKDSFFALANFFQKEQWTWRNERSGVSAQFFPHQ